MYGARPSQRALAEICRLAGSSAEIAHVRPLAGGQHSLTWRVDTRNPAFSVVVRQFPVGDRAAESERRVLLALDGLDGLAPEVLGGDLTGSWSPGQTSLLSRLDGTADITPADPGSWAEGLGRALAAVHAVPVERVKELPSIFDSRGSAQELDGALASTVRANWERVMSAERGLVHGDFWSGNVVARDGAVTGIVDWSGAARGPRGYDLGWCRLDLVLLFDVSVADIFLTAYETAAGVSVDEPWVWDSWALARSHGNVETWEPNYAPLGRPDLTPRELRRRHEGWTQHLVGRGIDE